MQTFRNIKNLGLCLGLMLVPALETMSQEKAGKAKASPEIMFREDALLTTSAITEISGQKLAKTPTTNIMNTFYGYGTGYYLQEGSGAPDDNAAWLKIRGLGTFNSADGYTVFVDGFQTDMSYAQRLLPAEIENIYILKDGAALSTFGMKGSNGVLWIETKKGHSGKPEVDFNFRQGFQRPLVISRPLNSAGYAMYYNEAYSNDAGGKAWTPYYSDEQIAAYKNGEGPDVDWYKEVLKEDPALFTSADISFSGGTSNMKYFAVLGYMNNSGFIDNKRDKDRHFSNTTYQQYTLRTNFEVSFLKIFEAYIGVGGYIADRSAPNYDIATLFGNLESYPANIYNPYDSDLINPDGSRRWSGTAVHPDNPLASVKGLGTRSSRDRSVQANFRLKEKLDFITEGLYLEEAVSFSNWIRGSKTVSRNYTRWYDGVEQTSDRDASYTISDDYGTNMWKWIQLRAQLGYDRKFGSHSVTGALKYEQYSRMVDADMNQYGFPGYLEDNLQMNYAYQNIAGRFRYSYDSRYVAEFGFAYSGSDNYMKGNRFSFYPSVSAAWIVSNENFLEDTESINLLKIRASWGQSGYDYSSYGRYLYDVTWTTDGGYPVGGLDNSEPGWINALTPSYLANPEITSERNTRYNVGVDARFFNAFDVNIDAFLEDRTGIVVRDQTYSSVVGLDAPFVNAGKVVTKGLELSLGYDRKIGPVELCFGFRGTYITDRVDFNGEIPAASAAADPVGHRIWTYFGYEADGFYTEDDFGPDGNLKTGLPVPSFGHVQPGDVRYKDLYPDGIINERDKTKIGNRNFPALYYSVLGFVSYKGFDFSFVLQGTGGSDVNLLDARSKFVPFENYSTVYGYADKSWAYYPEQGIDRRAGAEFPRLSTVTNSNNSQASSLWIRNGAYLKLRNVELGYTFPKRWLEKIRMRNLRIYVNAVNLFTVSELYCKYDVDPERLTGYPAVKSVNIGLTFGF